jgi:hypothetical protein
MSTAGPPTTMALCDLLADHVQIAYVTDDIDAATQHLETMLGTAPFHINRNASLGGTIRVDGAIADEWEIHAAMTYAGATNIEVIQPVRGAVDLYTDGIRPGHLLTIHHLGFVVDDFDEASRVVAASGRTWIQEATFGDIRFGYLDVTDELGHYAEIMELGPRATAYFASIEAESHR